MLKSSKPTAHIYLELIVAFLAIIKNEHANVEYLAIKLIRKLTKATI